MLPTEHMKTPHAQPRDSIDVERRRGELPFGMETRNEAVNYFAWQADIFREIARGRIIDHGAGAGGLSIALLDAGARDVVALEPDASLVSRLHQNLADRTGVRVFRGTLDDYLAEHGPSCVDCIVSSNVLEHVAQDVACLRAMWEALRPGGGVGIYVPARPELFGSLDRAVGHVRRYTAGELEQNLRLAGFDVAFVQYRNLAGVLPWLVAGRVLKLNSVGGGGVRFFDRVIFPVCRRLEDMFRPMYGLNLAAIGVKR
jgi:SAM-dependent methyltransferase